ncbi:5-hydroxytryptamine receptor 1A-alpha [Holothuria leucospilota]|uniref:5-hydroxytryptamine receptor 1A-alpha n=1 Tax=Holothuria leucospilota TaxID=206669 RepID=A0A9Q1CF17_HOLLE|nr:5-hydroxytryptamine receptor 1A-alpha [Holothuria leucospilota]
MDQLIIRGNDTVEEHIYIPVAVKAIHLVLGIAILGVNLIVMVAYAQDRDIRRVPANVLILNLSISDFVTGVDLIARFIWAVGLDAVVPLRQTVQCLLLGAFHYGSFVLSTLIVIEISWDRLKMVSNPFKYRQRTIRRVVVISTCSWCVPVLYVCYLAFVVPFVEDLFPSEYKGTVCLETHLPGVFVILSFWVDFFIPFIILFIINGLVILKLRKATLERFQQQKSEYKGTGRETSASETSIYSNINHGTIYTVSDGKENTLQNHTLDLITHPHGNGTTLGGESFPLEQSPTDVRIKEATKREFRKFYRTAAILKVFVGVYVICWMPFYVILAINLFTPIPEWGIILASANIAFNSFINAFLYAYMSRKFRRRFLLMFRCQRR